MTNEPAMIAEIVIDAEVVPTAEEPATESMHADLLESKAIQPPDSGVPRTTKVWLWWLLLPIRVTRWLLQLTSLTILLAVASTIPMLQFASLGYMLEVGKRIALGRTPRDWIPGLPKAGRLGVMAAGAYLTWLPVGLVIDYANSASIIVPGSPSARNWHIAAWLSFFLWMVHVCWAGLRGGQWHHFLWPAPIRFLKNFWRTQTWRQAEDAVWNYSVGLRIPSLMWLGFRASVGAILWLLVPSIFIIVGMQANEQPGLAGLGLVGGGMMMAVVLFYLPFLQLQMAREDRFRAIFDWRPLRHEFQRAPWAYFLAFFFTLLLAIPLYLFRIEKLPSELLWLPSLFFVLLMLPARMLVGWALRRGHRDIPTRFWLSRWAAWLLQIASVPTYLLFLYLATLTSWDGALVVLLQHTFLVPVPFLGR